MTAGAEYISGNDLQTKVIIVATTAKKGKVILADRHQGLLAGLRSLLEDIFEHVFMVADEASLLKAVEKINPDLIIADLSLPVTEEMNIARRLKGNFPGIKMIILSIHDEESAIRECFDAGADGYVLKRAAVDDLVPAIKAVLNGRSFLSRLPQDMLEQPTS